MPIIPPNSGLDDAIPVSAGVVVATVAPCVENPQVVEGTVIEDSMRAALELLHHIPVVCGPRIHLKVARRVLATNDSHTYTVKELYTDSVFALQMCPLLSTCTDVLRADLEVLKKLRHKSVLSYHDSFVSKVKDVRFFCVMFEPIQNGSLKELVSVAKRKRNPLQEDTIRGIVSQIASGLAYIHDQGALHGNLSPRNVLLNCDFAVKLSGFGLPTMARSVAAPQTVTGGLRMYAPPEWAKSRLLCRPLTPLEAPLPSYDVWGLGCLLMEMATLTFLEDRVGPAGSLNSQALPGALADMQRAYSGKYADLAQQLLQLDPDERPSASTVAADLPPVDNATSSCFGRVLRRVQKFICTQHVP